MDTTRPIIYRGFQANTTTVTPTGITGCIVQRVNSSGVRGVGYSEKKAISDGRQSSDVFLDGRDISLEGVIHALSRGDLFDRLQELTVAFTPTSAYGESPGDKGYLPLYFYVPTMRLAEWPTGEIQCFIRARPRAQPNYIIDRDKIGGDDNEPLAIPWSVVLEAKDPRIYIIPRIDTACTTSDNATVENRGSYPAPLNAMFIVPAGSGGTTITLAGGGADMTLTIPNDPLERIVRVSANDEVVTSQLAGGVETLALGYMVQAANTSYPKVPALSEANFVWTTTDTLISGSILWFYETRA